MAIRLPLMFPFRFDIGIMDIQGHPTDNVQIVHQNLTELGPTRHQKLDVTLSKTVFSKVLTAYMIMTCQTWKIGKYGKTMFWGLQVHFYPKFLMLEKPKAPQED